MSAFRIGTWALAAVVLAGMASRAEAQVYSGGSVRYSSGVGYAPGPLGLPPPPGILRGPFGGPLGVGPPSVGVKVGVNVGVNTAQGPLGGGAPGVRGPGVGVKVGVNVGVNAAPPTAVNPAPAVNWPYSEAYLARIPQGYGVLRIGEAPYYFVPTLPAGVQTTVVGGGSYYTFGGIYYRPYFYQGQTVYVVVQP
jgi:hypothetical protein